MIFSNTLILNEHFFFHIFFHVPNASMTHLTCFDMYDLQKRSECRSNAYYLSCSAIAYIFQFKQLNGIFSASHLIFDKSERIIILDWYQFCNFLVTFLYQSVTILDWFQFCSYLLLFSASLLQYQTGTCSVTFCYFSVPLSSLLQCLTGTSSVTYCYFSVPVCQLTGLHKTFLSFGCINLISFRCSLGMYSVSM